VGEHVQVHVLLTSALAGGEWLASRPSHFILRYPLNRRYVGPQNRSELYGEEKNLAPTGTRTPMPRPPNPYPVAIPAPRL
jgi:hypothetical protein